MFGLFGGGKDWSVLAIVFERPDLYTISAQRVKGGAAEKAREGAQVHPRTILWAVFDQKGKRLEGGTGSGALNVPNETVAKLEKDLPGNQTVQEVLKSLQSGQAEKLAKPLRWMWYPKKPALPPKDAPEE